MTPRTLRNLLVLAAEAERRIRVAGRVPPPQEYIMSALLPHARLVTRAAVALETAEESHGRARQLAHECAAEALAMARALADGCIEATPAVPKFEPFDPQKFTVTLASIPACGEVALTAGDLS